MSNLQSYCIPNPLNLNIFKPRHREKILYNLGISPTTTVLLIGSDKTSNTRKNLNATYEALKLLYQDYRHIDIELLILGNGEVCDLPFKMHHFGYVSDPYKLSDIYNAADLYIHSSLMDNLPNMVCEAQACGTPVIAFNRGGTSEAFAPNSSGLLTSEATPQSLCQAIKHLIEKPSELTAMRSEARAFAINFFDQKDVANKYANIYENILSFQDKTTVPKHSVPWENIEENEISSLASCVYASSYQNDENLNQIWKNIQDIVKRLSVIEPNASDLWSRFNQICERLSFIEKNLLDAWEHINEIQVKMSSVKKI